MSCKYFIKFVGTNNSSATYATAAAAGTALEIGITDIEPTVEFFGDDRTYISGVKEPSRMVRDSFKVNCYPFSSFRATRGDDIPQNSQTLYTLQMLFSTYKYVWLALPTSGSRIAPPRWTNTTDFANIAGLLPLRVVKTGIDISLNKDNEVGGMGSAEEVSLTLEAREL